MRSFYDDPNKAVSAAHNLLGDEANGQTLTALSQDLYRLGRYAKVFLKVIERGTYVLKELAFITDALTAGFGAANGADVTVTLGGRPAPINPPTLGQPFGPYQMGYGEVRPSEIFNGGNPSGAVSGVIWDTWGASQAVGHGTAEYVWPGVIVADGKQEPAVVIAFDLGICKGKPAYRAIQWYLPKEGQKFDPAQKDPIYDESYVAIG